MEKIKWIGDIQKEYTGLPIGPTDPTEKILENNIYRLTNEEVKWFEDLHKLKNADKEISPCLYKIQIMPQWGERIEQFLGKCVELRAMIDMDFSLEFNDTEVIVEGDDTKKSLYWKWKYNRDI